MPNCECKNCGCGKRDENKEIAVVFFTREELACVEGTLKAVSRIYDECDKGRLYGMAKALGMKMDVIQTLKGALNSVGEDQVTLCDESLYKAIYDVIEVSEEIPADEE